MEMVYDLLKITIPGVIVLYAVYLTLRSYMWKQLEEQKLVQRQKNQEITLPLRLQAYERICLLLERVSPSSLIPRLNDGRMSGKELQMILVSEIRGEFNHNLSQQVYMSEESWAYVKGAIEELISTINESGNELKPEATGLDLARNIFERYLKSEQDTIKNALTFIKNEIREVF